MRQVMQDLIAARDLLVADGWCRNYLKDDDGRHCAVGAVLAVTGLDSSRYGECLKSLAGNLPYLPYHTGAPYRDDAWVNVARYNNGNFEETVLDLFNNTIASLSGVKVEA